ncbi:Nitric oxide-dependent regulator DnrN or NorA [Indibacter alkaliphilus LW1]|uniref:Nitric oxide-dependent regulator DnrN or NorA n=1 Tax=Indibacter alkaliphilus (strain CCUG 57479 / KCTC 22604 / LW1) TaxID=1189612 RepID=S2DD54_INDAL|nr:iron-sulfur cluster repair di-iron protein [Indibacter alkaliphilus]EOZ96864.1 Nitric oxide-dependent regulator DnrN or NorA [Indibacter alkaliphilus LW1]
MEAIEKRKVGGIVAENFRTAKVFTEYGIDFCCKGGISLEAACEKNGVPVQHLVDDLMKVASTAPESKYTSLSISDLIDHIISVHHSYVENNIPPLKAYLQKLALVHGERHPELHQIKELFFEASDGLTVHMKKEELVLFPYIKAMQASDENGFPLSAPHFGHIDNPIAMMEHEHDTEGERFRQISQLSDGYNAPADGCQTYRVAFAMLKEFEEDLHTHIHLENNILFPKAKALYEIVNKK